MRQSLSRSVIYAVIGIGLLAIIVSKFAGTNPQTAVVPHPFDSLDEYQPNLDSEFASNPVPAAAPYPVDSYSLASQAVVQPQPIEQHIPMENVRNDFGEAPEALNPIEDTNSFNELVDSPNEYSLSNQSDADSIEINDFEGFAAVDSMVMTEEANASSEMTPPRFNADPQDLYSALLEPRTDPQPEPQPEPQPVVDSGVRVAALGQPAETVEAAVVPTNTPWKAPIDIRSARKGWKTNPFIKNDTPAATPQPTAQEAIKSDVMPTTMLSPETPTFQFEEYIPAQDNGAVDVLATASTIQETETIVEPLMPPVAQPAIDHETMRSVLASENTRAMNSPPIRVGLSETDAQKAVHNIEYGKSLSRRGSSFAARQEFYSALRILAQSHDNQSSGKAYTKALARGIMAIKEAEDFMVTDTETQIGLNVMHVAETHSTRIFSPEAAEQMTAIEAVQRYLAYASQQLSLCGGENVVSSEALYCLGKLHSVQAKSGTNSSKIDVVKSMAFHQAAVAADSTNFRSLNELGVLYANSGRFPESKDLLKRSLRIKQLPQAWQNLGVIHQRLGEQQLAELANKEYQMVSSQKTGSSIRWTAAEEFNKNAPILNRTADQSNQPSPTKSKSLGDRILDSIR